jgi:hypothetical protein
MDRAFCFGPDTSGLWQRACRAEHGYVKEQEALAQ